MCDRSACEPKGEEDAGETIGNLLITSDYNCKCYKANEKAWQMSLYPNLDTIETAIFSCSVSLFSLQCQRELGADAVRLCPTHVLENGKWAFCIAFLPFSEEKGKNSKVTL